MCSESERDFSDGDSLLLFNIGECNIFAENSLVKRDEPLYQGDCDLANRICRCDQEDTELLEQFEEDDNQSLQDSLSNQEFIKKILQNDTILLRDLQIWKKEFNITRLDEDNLMGIINGDINLSEEHLTEDGLQYIKLVKTQMQEMDMSDLLNLVSSSL